MKTNTQLLKEIEKRDKEFWEHWDRFKKENYLVACEDCETISKTEAKAIFKRLQKVA